MRFVLVAGGAGLLVVGFLACVGDDPGAATSAAPGERLGACFANGTCREGLVCRSGEICLAPEEPFADAGTGPGDASLQDAPVATAEDACAAPPRLRDDVTSVDCVQSDNTILQCPRSASQCCAGVGCLAECSGGASLRCLSRDTCTASERCLTRGAITISTDQVCGRYPRLDGWGGQSDCVVAPDGGARAELCANDAQCPRPLTCLPHAIVYQGAPFLVGVCARRMQ